MDSQDLQNFKTDLMSKFDGDNNLVDITPNSEIFAQDALYSMDDDVDSDNEPDDIIPIHMHIRDPIENLRKLLEDRLGITLSNYPITLQNTQLLDPLKNLVEQCVNGEGIVQINAQIKFYEKRINIYDVLQPINEYNASNAQFTKMEDEDIKEESESKSVSADEISSDNDNGNDNENENELIKWVIDAQFKNDQARLKIPDDPNEWTVAQVKHWLQWAVRQFNLSRIKLSDWCLTGSQLCEMEFPEFQKKVPFDDSNVFWTHIELLRKCRFVAVLQRSENVKAKTIEDNNPDTTQMKKTPKLIRHKQTKNLFLKDNSIVSVGIDVNQGNRSGNNGQIQLWQFLLEILTDHEHRQIIHWIGGEGEFKFVDPEKVAQLWGERKNKPTMNYEKLSRALRYYYDGDMISKVHGKRFVYKFVCNLQQLIGYDAQELSNLVNAMNL